MSIDESKARAIAVEDAAPKYGSLTPYEIRVQREGSAWRVDFELRPPLTGGGPHYLIDGTSGEIRWKRYEQ